MGQKPLGFPWHGERHLLGKLNQSWLVQSGMASCAYNCTREYIDYRERGHTSNNIVQKGNKYFEKIWIGQLIILIS